MSKKWRARGSGEQYEHEKLRAKGNRTLQNRRRKGVWITAPTHYLARQLASVRLGLADEHIIIERKGGV